MKILRPEEVVSIKDLAWNATPQQVAEALQLAREAFTAADLQKFTEVEEGISAEEVLAELEKQQQAYEEGHRDGQ
jgi:hypothetical protein